MHGEETHWGRWWEVWVCAWGGDSLGKVVGGAGVGVCTGEVGVDD